MSITICYRPRTDKSPRFRGGTSKSFGVLREVFGSLLSIADIPKLRAMTIATDDPFYAEVAETIERVGEVEFWSEY